MYDWDKAKRRPNLAKHALDFTAAARFGWHTAITVDDNRQSYGERRLFSTGLIDGRLHILIWTPRGTGPRIISLRKANPRKRKRWENEKS